MTDAATQEVSFERRPFSVWQRVGSAVRRRWWILAITLALAICVQAVILYREPARFGSVARMVVSGRLAIPEGSLYREEAANFFGTQIELMTSPAVKSGAEARVRAAYPELKPTHVDLQVSQTPRTSVFVLQAIGETPEYTRLFLEAVLEEYLETKRSMRSATSNTTLSAITDELVTMERELESSESALIEFQSANNVGFLQEEGNSAGAYLATLHRKLAALKTEHDFLEMLESGKESQAAVLAQAIDLAPESSSGDQPSGMSVPLEFRKALQELENLKAQRKDYAKYLKDRHPIIVELDGEIERQQRTVEMLGTQGKEEIKARKTALSVQMENLDKQIKEWEGRALDLSRRLAEYDRLKSRKERAKGAYDRLISSMRTVDVDKKVDQEAVSVLDKASPAQPVKPDLLKSLLGAAAAGLLLGGVIVYARERSADHMMTAAEFQWSFPERILGQVPWDRTRGETPLLKVDDKRHMFTEAFSNIRSSLLFLPSNDQPRPSKILVTSALPGEGKSTVASNLAVVMATGGQKTLLIDADLRRGTQHRCFDLISDIGFSDVLSEGLDWKKTVMATKFPNLSVIPRGKTMTQPGKFLLGETVDKLLREVSAEFDLVVIDTCPVLVADDPTSLAPRIDGTLFVFRMNFTPAREARRALDALYSRRVNVIGAVLNGGEMGSGDYVYYNYPELQESAAG